MKKTLHNTNPQDAQDNTPDLQISGDPGCWQLLCKASSKLEGWMKSTKVMEIERVYDIEGVRLVEGCLVQVTTQQGDHIAEALVYVPGIRIASCGTKLIAI